MFLNSYEYHILFLLTLSVDFNSRLITFSLVVGESQNKFFSDSMGKPDRQAKYMKSRLRMQQENFSLFVKPHIIELCSENMSPAQATHIHTA